jgi:hypothetical protein
MRKLSITEWAGGVSSGCDVAWVDEVLPVFEPTVAIERIDAILP